ncbi:MAG: type II toxin-antitoxin system RelE/ParE family toxin [Chitinophagaceae bacterium]|jgi:plasmid stabilization system protein ParE|nr:type II toxin-antitoxin system RelE/ParE family toxin [Chitinophagaceae bacterium]
MPKQLVVTRYADEDILNITSYLKQEWGNKVAENFLAELLDFYQLVELQPKSFSFYIKSKNIRKFSMKNVNLILYRLKKTKIEIIAVIDGRKQPSAIKKLTRSRL